jgi:KipI family sensor histidine kinase inhibitor
MRLHALGDSAIVAEFGGGISPAALRKVRIFSAAVDRAKIAGVTDIVPAFATVAVFFDPAKLAGETASPHAHLHRLLAALPTESDSFVDAITGREIAIPVCYGGEFGPDLAALAVHAGITPAEVIRLHSGASYLVHAIGFAPGFPYLGGLPGKLHAPRRPTPRPRVPPGSVGIGGAQTGIYPIETPGGWQLIGRTPKPLFDLERAEPALLRVGDQVKFHAIPPAEFHRLTEKCHLIDDTAKPGIASGAVGECHPLDDTCRMRVLRAGMLTTVQDLGRFGQRAAGVPLSGAMDSMALRVANFLVGNPAGTAALEFTLVGPEVEFLSDAVVALGGAEFHGLPRWQPVRVPAGTRLDFGAARSGARGYLAVAGGFAANTVFGSGSTYLRAGFGGFAGRALRAGDMLRGPRVARQVRDHWRIDERILPRYSSSPTVRVVRGTQGEEMGTALFSGKFQVTPQSDRMGLRLSGSKLVRTSAAELLSTAVTPGTIQVPPDGQPIILMADAQTIGGYPQAAHVITVDLPLVAQLRPGDSVEFCEVSLEDAEKLLLAREQALSILHEGLAQKIG